MSPLFLILLAAAGAPEAPLADTGQTRHYAKAYGEDADHAACRRPSPTTATAP